MSILKTNTRLVVKLCKVHKHLATEKASGSLQAWEAVARENSSTQVDKDSSPQKQQPRNIYL